MTKVKISREKDRLVIRAEGTEFLKIKHAVTKELSERNIKPEGKGAFSIPWDFAGRLRGIIKDSYIEDSELESSIQKEELSLKAHTKARGLVSEIVENQRSVVEDTKWRDILDPHQGIAVNAMTVQGLRGLCLFDEQGTGKTITGLATLDVLIGSDGADGAFIAAPKTMLSEWSGDIESFLGEKYIVNVMRGSSDEKYAQSLKESDIYIFNLESLDSLLTRLISIASRKRMMLFIDESFFVKNPRAQRSIAAMALRRKCIKGFLLCGTPAPNSPQDLRHQFDLADLGFTFGDFKAPDDPGRLKEEVGRRIDEKGTYIRRLKSDVLPDLPEKQLKIHTIEMRGKQAQLYNDARNKMELFLTSMDNSTFKKNLATYFQKRAALLLICVCPSSIDSLYDETPAKYTALDEMLEDLIDKRGQKVVVWSYYRHSLDEMAARYASRKHVRVDGSIADSERRSAIANFQEDTETGLFLGNPAAAGAGITLHSAKVAIYLSYPLQAAHYLQSLDRIHRRGQTAKSVEYHFLICRNTIEEHEVTRLAFKEKNQGALLKDDTSGVNLEMALEEIKSS